MAQRWQRNQKIRRNPKKLSLPSARSQPQNSPPKLVLSGLAKALMGIDLARLEPEEGWLSELRAFVQRPSGPPQPDCIIVPRRYYHPGFTIPSDRRRSPNPLHVGCSCGQFSIQRRRSPNPPNTMPIRPWEATQIRTWMFLMMYSQVGHHPISRRQIGRCLEARLCGMEVRDVEDVEVERGSEGFLQIRVGVGQDSNLRELVRELGIPYQVARRNGLYVYSFCGAQRNFDLTQLQAEPQIVQHVIEVFDEVRGFDRETLRATNRYQIRLSERDRSELYGRLQEMGQVRSPQRWDLIFDAPARGSNVLPGRPMLVLEGRTFNDFTHCQVRYNGRALEIELDYSRQYPRDYMESRMLEKFQRFDRGDRITYRYRAMLRSVGESMEGELPRIISIEFEVSTYLNPPIQDAAFAECFHLEWDETARVHPLEQIERIEALKAALWRPLISEQKASNPLGGKETEAISIELGQIAASCISGSTDLHRFRELAMKLLFRSENSAIRISARNLLNYVNTSHALTPPQYRLLIRRSRVEKLAGSRLVQIENYLESMEFIQSFLITCGVTIHDAS
ncbi:hypothetical protein H6G00_01660 [Leptolyngbya sp. FACHB-541]|uniref:hypothetical protein n=1 Tax=Leptolyngbya sp. FACHB-541 TaxID=2692810 RepID=UPI001682274B|nr:hypothetical protein [Leptolyngbya sp. FACHB-541]MBD1995337.1 hypothetical protein [Leptolyngbya sp. FACHB-541]